MRNTSYEVLLMIQGPTIELSPLLNSYENSREGVRGTILLSHPVVPDTEQLIIRYHINENKP